jgi:hypothetical protein
MTTTSSNRILTSNEASIQTATVDVKVIRIGQRQMTLSVFRQLKKEALIDWDVDERVYQLRGQPWGLVNYCPGCCKQYEHLHVVWQKDNELRRASVVLNWYEDEDLRADYASAFPNAVDESIWDCVRLCPLRHSPRAQEEYVRRVELYGEVYQVLKRLDQLFIAV